MLQRLCETYGTLMPSPPLGFTLPTEPASPLFNETGTEIRNLYAFPTPAKLAQAGVTERLRELGFGYRAAYVSNTAKTLCELASKDPETDSIKAEARSPEAYLHHLASQPYAIAHENLVSHFDGVGPKVGDCICLFGLGFVGVVPVDVHVYQIAMRDYGMGSTLPSSSPRKKSTAISSSGEPKKKVGGGPVSKAVYEYVKARFLEIWGPWAGWAQQILFLADLKQFAASSQTPSVSQPKQKRKLERSVSAIVVKSEESTVQVKLEARDNDLDQTGVGIAEGVKRLRRTRSQSQR